MELHRQPGCWLRSSHSLKECVIAHWSSECAPKINGAKLTTEVWGLIAISIGRGAIHTGRSTIVRGCGLYGRENAGMSSESVVIIHAVECPRFPGEGLTTQGKSGTKSRAKAVDDVQLVDIPVPLNTD